MVDKCFEEEVEQPSGTATDTGEVVSDGDTEVDPVDVGSDTELNNSSTAADAMAQRPDFRPPEPSNNFITENKMIRSPTSAVARKKYMIQSNHFVSSKMARDYRSDPNYSTGRSGWNQLRFPQDVFRFQEELPASARLEDLWKDHPDMYYNTDQLLFCLGGYYAEPTVLQRRLYRLQYQTRIDTYLPSNTNWFPSLAGHRHDGFMTTPIRSPNQRSAVVDGLPFKVKIQKLESTEVENLLSNNQFDEFLKEEGHKEIIKFNFGSTSYFTDSDSYDSSLAPANTKGKTHLAQYLYGGFLRNETDSHTNSRNHENLASFTRTFEHYDFITDMPFFAKETEKIDNMKNLTVSTRLESNFVTSGYRSYGDNTGETENFLPSIYFLNTFEKIKSFTEEERADYLEAVSPENANDYQKKMLFTSEDVQQFKKVNDEFKGKVPMYVEFDIGTNQASPLAEILSKTGLDKLFLQFVSQKTLDRSSGVPFAEILEGSGGLAERLVRVGSQTVARPAGEREIFITEGADGKKTPAFNFETWLNLFFAEDYRNKGLLEKDLLRNGQGQFMTADQVLVADTQHLNDAGQRLTQLFGRALRQAHGRLRGGLYAEVIEDANADNVNRHDATAVHGYLNGLSHTAAKEYFFGRASYWDNVARTGVPEERSGDQMDLMDAFNKYRVAIARSARNRHHAQRNLLESIAVNKAEKQRLVEEILSGIDIKNFPLKTQSEISEFDQFRLLIQSVVLKGKLDTRYRSLYRTYSELFDGQNEFAYSETVMYRIDKHRVDLEGGVASVPVQSFYMMDSDDIENINFIDSQVIFGQRYIYRVYSYDFVVGTQYEYDDIYRDNLGKKIESTTDPGFRRGQLSSINRFYNQDNEFNLYVNSKPIYKIVEIPYFEKELIIMDRPPMFPEVRFYQVNDSINKFKISLQATSGERRMDPIIIETAEQAVVDDMRKVQGLMPGDPIFYESDDLPINYEVFRTDSPPLSYNSFRGKMLHYLTEQKAAAVDFYESIDPNKKYYYTFRCMDKSMNLSNPSIVYQVELVSQEGYSYLDVRPYEFPKAKRTFKTNFERLLFIKASELQKAFTVGDDPETTDTTEVGTFGRGAGGSSIFNQKKRYKIRIKSKHSQKKVDLNLSFVQEYSDDTNDTQNDPVTAAEASRQQRLPQNIDFQRVNSLYGDEYEKFIEGVTSDTETGGTIGKQTSTRSSDTMAAPQREGPVLPPEGDGY